MISNIKITPKFDSRKIIDKTIGQTWFKLQSLSYDLGAHTLNYMQGFINENRKRDGGTGNLAKSMTLDTIHGAGSIFWGIGNINHLNSVAKYWYVVNYGKMITGLPFKPGAGQFVPGYFGQGNSPDPALKGRGGEQFTHGALIMPGQVYSGGIYPGVIRPLGYIQATKHQMDVNFRRILKRLRVSIK